MRLLSVGATDEPDYCAAVSSGSAPAVSCVRSASGPVLIRRESRIRTPGMRSDVYRSETARNDGRGGERVKRILVRAFEVSASLAVLLNVFAAAVAIKRDAWSIAFGYIVISAILAGALAVHWYAAHRQAPYRWRDEGWGLERWREGTPDEDAESDDDDVWRDDRD